MAKAPITTTASSREETKLYLDILLAQYKSVRDEILAVLKETHDLSIYSLVSTAGLATLIVTLINSSPNLLASFLIVLPLPFMAMLITFLGHLVAAANLSNYVSSHIETQIEDLLLTMDIRSPRINQFIGWDTFIHKEMRFSIRWLHTMLWPVGQGALICMPILVSLVAFYFTVSIAHLPLIPWWQIVLWIDTVVLVFCFITSIIAIHQIGLLRNKS
jgi:hypothetical protein